MKERSKIFTATECRSNLPTTNRFSRWKPRIIISSRTSTGTRGWSKRPKSGANNHRGSKRTFGKKCERWSKPSMTWQPKKQRQPKKPNRPPPKLFNFETMYST